MGIEKKEEKQGKKRGKTVRRRREKDVAGDEETNKNEYVNERIEKRSQNMGGKKDRNVTL